MCPAQVHRMSYLAQRISAILCYSAVARHGEKDWMHYYITPLFANQHDSISIASSNATPNKKLRSTIRQRSHLLATRIRIDGTKATTHVNKRDEEEHRESSLLNVDIYYPLEAHFTCWIIDFYIWTNGAVCKKPRINKWMVRQLWWEN